MVLINEENFQSLVFSFIDFQTGIIMNDITARAYINIHIYKRKDVISA